MQGILQQMKEGAKGLIPPTAGPGGTIGKRRKLPQGEVTQPGAPQLGKDSHNRKSIAGFHHGKKGLLGIAEDDLVRIVGGDNLSLDGEQGGGAGGRVNGSDPSGLFQMLQGELLLLGQRVIFPTYTYHRTAHQFPVDAVFGGVFLKGKQQLNFAIRHQVIQRAEGIEARQGKDVRGLLPQAIQGRAYQLEIGGAAAADLQPCGLGSLAAFDLDLRDPGQLEHLACVLQKHMTCLGQPNGFAGAAEELDPKFILQSFDLVTDCGLGDSQVFRRPGEVQKVRHRHETF